MQKKKECHRHATWEPPGGSESSNDAASLLSTSYTFITTYFWFTTSKKHRSLAKGFLVFPGHFGFLYSFWHLCMVNILWRYLFCECLAGRAS